MSTAWGAAGLTRDCWERHSLDIRIRLAAAPYMQGWSYSLSQPGVLWDLPADMKASSLVGRSTATNCSTLTTSLLTSVWPTRPWGLLEYGDLQVFGNRLPSTDSPVRAVVRVGVGVAVTTWACGEWYLVQGVRRGPEDPAGFSGHAFLVLCLGEGVLQVLEATSRSGLGPRYRDTTPEALAAEYPAALHLARLQGP